MLTPEQFITKFSLVIVIIAFGSLLVGILIGMLIGFTCYING